MSVKKCACVCTSKSSYLPISSNCMTAFDIPFKHKASFLHRIAGGRSRRTGSVLVDLCACIPIKVQRTNDNCIPLQHKVLCLDRNTMIVKPRSFCRRMCYCHSSTAHAVLTCELSHYRHAEDIFMLSIASYSAEHATFPVLQEDISVEKCARVCAHVRTCIPN